MLDTFATFFVTSGALCYGALHNIWGGAVAAVNYEAFRNIQPHVGGTVKHHQLTHNVPALNGTWNVFQLVDVDTKMVTGWFASHIDINPMQEIDKILRVSGSPYEYDSGSSLNDNATEAEGVLVINRYDWGYHSQPFYGDFGESIKDSDSDIVGNSNSAGLVDYAHAKAHVMRWKEKRPSERVPSDAAVWMYNPGGEYMFGRFGFNDAGTAARSFLFFSISTTFTRTAFAGQKQPLRKEESHEQRFERRLRTSFDFSGIDILRRMSARSDDPASSGEESALPESDWLGPFDPRDYVFWPDDFEAIRVYHKAVLEPELEEALHARDVVIENYIRGRKYVGFVEPWKEPLFDLLNELVLSYLQRYIVPAIFGGISTPIQVLLPSYTHRQKLDNDHHQYYRYPLQKPIPGFNAEFVNRRLAAYLKAHTFGVNYPPTDNFHFITQIVTYMMFVVLGSANNCAVDNYHFGIMPSDVRISVYNDPRLYTLLKYSATLLGRKRLD
jgi:hypothetical protein